MVRRLFLIALAVSLPVTALAAVPARFELAPGDSVLWSGPLVESSSGDQTFDYSLNLTDPARRLRIGIDHPQVGDVFGVVVRNPKGAQTVFSVGPGIYSEERIFDDPTPGVWQIEVTAQTVSDSAFRIRAKLEDRLPSLGTRTGPVLPNLQVLPPHDAAFIFPVTNGAGDQEPIGVDIAGREGCHPEEHAEDQAIRCLRFGFGVRNTGLGPMDLSHSGTSPLEHDLFQRVYYADGSSKERYAGKAVYHKTHAHWHHADAVGLRLFSVKDTKRGILEPAGAKRTKGFAHRNELLRDWNVFYPMLDVRGFGLRPGWGDIYEWDRPGNYIDFGLNGDGYYVIRMWADPTNGILESNDEDNEGYTYMKITGSEVELIEAGRGSDPWDPCKIVVGFGGFPDPPRGPRPASCAPDTT
ncbi:MAG: hypothetical protein QOK47_1057 [Actinomycetota bacterium]|nr:hypothetical protein [Actinomycetota bacterium]